MVLDRYRKAADRILVPVASRMLRTNPNAVSWVAFLAAVGAGLGFFVGGGGFLGLALLLILVNAYLDALDGKIAKMAGKASSRGDFLDHVLDRYADVFMIGGIAFSAYCDLRVGTLALLGVLLTSYMGTQAQAVGQGRRYAGLLGRADRLVLLFVGARSCLRRRRSAGESLRSRSSPSNGSWSSSPSWATRRPCNAASRRGAASRARQRSRRSPRAGGARGPSPDSTTADA